MVSKKCGTSIAGDIWDKPLKTSFRAFCGTAFSQVLLLSPREDCTVETCAGILHFLHLGQDPGYPDTTKGSQFQRGSPWRIANR